MKRKSLLFFLLIALLAPLAMNGQRGLTQVTGSTLEVGSTYVITYNSQYAITNTVMNTSNNHFVNAVSFSSSSSPTDDILWTIESGNATNGYIFKNVDNNKYIGYTSDEYLTVVTSGGMAMKFDGDDLINNVDSDGYYYLSCTNNNTSSYYFTTSKSQTNKIVLYKYTSDSGSSTTCEDFEGISGTYNTAGSMPNGWFSYTTATGNSIVAPHVVNSGSYCYPNSGSGAINMESGTNANNKAYVVLPLYNNVTELTYYARCENTSYGTLKVGYVDAQTANACNNFTALLSQALTTSVTQYTVDFANTYTLPAGKYIAFQWEVTTGSYWSCGIDDVCVTTSEASNLHVTVWTETDLHTAWGTVQIGNDTPGTSVETYVEEGTQITVTATPDECHTFAYWVPNGGGGNITQNPATITVNDDLDLQAVFTAITYNITATPNNSSYGSVSGGGNNLGCGSTCTLTATANTGYGFMGWQLNGNIVSTDNPYTIAVNANAAYTAVFEQVSEHTITVTQATGGTINASANTAYMGDVITLTATPVSGYFLAEWIVKDASQNPITVTNNQFTMPNSDVTVTATFTQGFHVTLNQTPNGTISADQTTNLQPGDIVTLTATPDNDCVFLAWYVFKDGNPRDVIALVNDSWFFMPSSNVTVQAVFVTEEEHEQTVGGGDNTHNYLPTNVYYNYSLTQQIYTAAEIGYNGRITAIAFKALANITNARTLDIYMAHTTKTAFSSRTDWQTMGPSFLVYSGSVSFANNDWTTITLDTPFEYDGTSNLNICVVDITEDYESSSRAFSTYSTSANRALYVCSDTEDYSQKVNASGISDYTGTLGTTNNQIKFTIRVPGSATSLTISPDAINDFSYVEGQGPSETRKLDIVGVDLENNITLTAPTNFEICLTEDGTYESSLTIPRETSKRGRNVTTWDFEDGLQNWTALDVDNDGYSWEYTTDLDAHNSSTGCVASASFINNVGALTPDNWLVSPQVELGGTFSLWAVAQDQAWPQEHFGIYVSTDGETFTILGEWTLAAGDWKQYSVDLSAFAEQNGYIAVRHFNCTDKFSIKVDDFMLDTDAAISVEMPVTMTLETVFVRMKANLNRGNYSGTLTASAGTGNNVNGSVSLSGVVEAPSYNITLIANPIDGGNAEGGGIFPDGSSVTVTATTRGNYSFINWTENGTEVSTDATYTFTVTGDRTLTANFGFKKHIVSYDDTTISGWNGWYLITSPLADETNPANVTNLKTNTYDLYRFDQAAELEWINYLQSDGHTVNTNFGNLVAGQGYLYANSQTVDLVFIGTAYSGNGNIPLIFDNTNSDSHMHGWNLIGNPFPVSATIDESFDFMQMNATHTDIELGGPESIAPMEGIFVRATEEGQSVTLTPGSQKTTNGDRIMINISQNQKVIDRAAVRFGEGNQLPKYQLRQNSTKIYFPVDGEDFAVVRSEGVGELPVNFKAEENGNYTLSLNTEGVNFGYLHLVDNMTGNDVDMLANPSYSFEARTTDYASRFKLVFATGDNANDNFAYFSNGSFVINNDGNATLQVIDVTGRILKSESINGCTNLNFNAVPGVYMIRLVNGTDVKVQKVVVK